MIYTIRDLNHMPYLRALITNYVLLRYEEAADVSDEMLLIEYNSLVLDGNLEDLFHSEWITGGATENRQETVLL